MFDGRLEQQQAAGGRWDNSLKTIQAIEKTARKLVSILTQLPVSAHLHSQATMTSVLCLLATKSCGECISPRSKKRSCGATRLNLEILRIVEDLQELASEGGGKGKPRDEPEHVWTLPPPSGHC